MAMMKKGGGDTSAIPGKIAKSATKASRPMARTQSASTVANTSTVKSGGMSSGSKIASGRKSANMANKVATYSGFAMAIPASPKSSGIVKKSMVSSTLPKKPSKSNMVTKPTNKPVAKIMKYTKTIKPIK